jgi:murein DD-endopeptidase MepM/ murein hydrolase activator NlpD
MFIFLKKGNTGLRRCLKMSKKKFTDSFSSKGYYIALVLCAVAIGVAGFLYYRNADNIQLQKDPTSGQQPTGNDVQAVATQPGEVPPGATDPVAEPKKPEKRVSPVSGSTVAAYSMDALVYNQTTRDWRVHNGMDIAAQEGTQVCAAADGTVYTVYEDETMGMTVVISHGGGYSTRYSSLAEEVSVKAGDTVTAGQTIGKVGNTALMENAIGDHLHFGVSCNGKAVDPVDFLN